MDGTTRQLMQDKAKAFLLDLLLDNRGLSLAEVSEVLVELATSETVAAPAGAKRRGRPPDGKRSGRPAANAKLQTRTKEGRAAYDAVVLAAMKELGGQDLSARQIRAAAGGDPNQFRAAIDRHIAETKATFTGEKAAMRYSLA